MGRTALAGAAVAVLAMTPATALATTGDTAEVSGHVWLDLDGDGSRDDAEPTRSGVQVTLRTSATILDATTTGADGGWTFANVQPGTYSILVEPPIDHVVTGGTLPELDTSSGRGTVAVAAGEQRDAGTVGIGSPVLTGADVTATVSLERDASATEGYRWAVTPHNMGPDDTAGPIDVRMVLSADHETLAASGDGWACEPSAAIVLCQHDSVLDSGTSLPPITLETTPTGDIGSTVTVTATVRLDGIFDAAPLNDEAEAAATISTDLAAVDLDGDGTGDLTNAGSTATGILVAALLALLAGAAALRTSSRP